jgi:hypothetical protein
VRIVQLLCPGRHCILATAYESPDGQPIPEAEQRLREMADSLIRTGGINPWCGICRSRDWRYEDRATVFETMNEARPHLELAELQNAGAREYFRASRG